LNKSTSSAPVVTDPSVPTRPAKANRSVALSDGTTTADAVVLFVSP
jgi:hypothetical protein